MRGYPEAAMRGESVAPDADSDDLRSPGECEVYPQKKLAAGSASACTLALRSYPQKS
jgi:hypothetical protein